MGVTGLWRLIEPAGKPVPVETLENKVLAVDISIWLHQVVKGYQDARGAPMPNAHLMGLFQRLCKLLYFRIKPVFVFDGGFPELKKETIAKRQDSKNKYNSESERLKREIVLLLGKKTAIGSILGQQISPIKQNRQNLLHDNADNDLFKLPALPQKDEETDSDSEEDSSSGSIVDLHSVDLNSENFKTMPSKEKYELLLELKETRKMNSWGRLHELPKKSDNFSDFQMERLLKRRKVQECIEETEKEIGGNCMSLNELENLLNEEGIDTKIESLPTHRIASNNTTRFILIKDVKQAMEDAKQRQKKLETLSNKEDIMQPSSSKQILEEKHNNIEDLKVNEFDEDLNRAIQMSLECVDEQNNTTSEPNTSTCRSIRSDESMDSSFILDSDYSDTEDDDDFVAPDMSSAKAYIMQYSDFTHKAIDNIINNKSKSKSAKKCNKVSKILEELNIENPIITDKIELCSSESERERSISPDVIDIPDENTSIDSNTTSNQNNSIHNIKSNNTSQSSVVCIESSTTEVVTLDSTVDNEEAQPTQKNKCEEDDFVIRPVQSCENDSDSEEDFEEVPEKENIIKPIVQVQLNMGEAPDDDIFADVFEDRRSDSIVSTDNKVDSKIFHKSDNIVHVQNTIQNEGDNCKNTRPTVKNIQIDLENCNKDDNNTSVSESIKHSESEPKNSVFKENLQHFSKDELNSMAESLEIEEGNLMQEKARVDRIGRSITEQMTKEVQELLQIFGIPYIVAPMEAEAQCAFLESVKLTDGTITDDSDIWLFGGQTVYKNFFNQNKHVLQFVSERIEKSFNLNREQLVLLALLVGSDYTTGVAGVGPVTAMEILASFPYNKKEVSADSPLKTRYSRLLTGLQEFKNWAKAGKRTDNTVLKKKLRNVNVGDDFPSTRVVQAYFEPNVEKSKENFTWGELDVTVLRDYTKTKFGWSQSKLDEIINPVVKRLLERKSQKTLQDYFKRKIDFQCLEDQMSKRVKAAVQKMGPEGSKNEENEEVEKTKAKVKRKRKVTAQVNNKDDTTITNSTETTDSVDELLKNVPKTKKKAVLKKITIAENSANPTSSNIEIQIPKLDRYQEIIPQREKDREHVLQNKMKAIEIFRKTKIDKKNNRTKRRINLPKEKAELSESDSD